MIALALAEDHSEVRKSICAICNDGNFCFLLIEAANGYDLLTQLAKTKKEPEIALIDIQMPVMDGLSLALFLREFYPKIAVIGISSYTITSTIFEMFEAGAKGYIVKGELSSRLLKEAVNAIRAGDLFIFGNIENKEKILLAAKKALPHEDPKPPTFSYKERMFLHLSCTSITHDEMADLMNVSKESIYNYQKSLKDKIGARSRPELTLYAIRHGITRIAKQNISRGMLVAYSILSGVDLTDFF